MGEGEEHRTRARTQNQRQQDTRVDNARQINNDTFISTTREGPNRRAGRTSRVPKHSLHCRRVRSARADLQPAQPAQPVPGAGSCRGDGHFSHESMHPHSLSSRRGRWVAEGARGRAREEPFLVCGRSPQDNAAAPGADRSQGPRWLRSCGGRRADAVDFVAAPGVALCQLLASHAHEPWQGALVGMSSRHGCHRSAAAFRLRAKTAPGPPPLRDGSPCPTDSRG